MIESLHQYVNYLRQPGKEFMSIKDYNSKFNTDIKENGALEVQIKRARKEMGPNDFLPHSFGLKRKTYKKMSKDIGSKDIGSKEEPTYQAKERAEKTLDDLLSEDVEEEYEEACDNCGKKKCSGHEFEEQLDGLAIEDAQTLNHLIAFKGETEDITTRVMKGKARYIDQLKAYVNGDNNVAVRLYNGKKVNVSDLSPNKDSLREMFDKFPAGPHIIECD